MNVNKSKAPAHQVSIFDELHEFTLFDNNR